MPYIEQGAREVMDKVVGAMVDAEIKANGDLNYVLFKLAKYHIEPGYGNYKNYCGELRQCATEIERKLLGPYEDLKEKENGPIL